MKRTPRTIAKSLTLAARQMHAIELKSEGLTYDQVADEFLKRGFTTKRPARRTCIRWVQAALKTIGKQTEKYAIELLVIEDRRLELAVNAIIGKVKDGNLGAIDTLVRISESRRRLWGADKTMATKTETETLTKLVIEYVDYEPPHVNSESAASKTEDGS